MKVLAVGDQHGIHGYLQDIHAQRLEELQLQTSSWQNFQAEGIAVFQPDIIICAVLLPYTCEEVERQQFAALLASLIEYAECHAIPILLLSTAAVFDGARIAYKETDEPCPNTDYGRFYYHLEQQVLSYKKAIVLRSSWVYSAAEQGFLSNVVNYAAADQCIRINSAAKSCPTAASDIARVFFAILLQIEQGADNWGVFHYVAADNALGFQFVEAILQQASRYQDSIDPKQVCFEHHQQPNMEFYFSAVVLRCQRIQGNFGIHQRAWRSLMPAVVREHHGLDKPS